MNLLDAFYNTIMGGNYISQQRERKRKEDEDILKYSQALARGEVAPEAIPQPYLQKMLRPTEYQQRFNQLPPQEQKMWQSPKDMGMETPQAMAERVQGSFRRQSQPTLSPSDEINNIKLGIFSKYYNPDTDNIDFSQMNDEEKKLVGVGTPELKITGTEYKAVAPNPLTDWLLPGTEKEARKQIRENYYSQFGVVNKKGKTNGVKKQSDPLGLR